MSASTVRDMARRSSAFSPTKRRRRRHSSAGSGERLWISKASALSLIDVQTPAVNTQSI